ncbi:MAG: sodium-dependent transporter [Planctomycetaceae bacterium]|nr:sodium-dependent transporter [Planctomycetaceae bacterium]
MSATPERAHWKSRFGFILAAAGSAIGLGNIWKFPYITGENGGGWFVLIYLACILLVGLPIMMAEIFIGRTAQKSPVGAFRELSAPKSPWMLVGWLGVAAGFVILSYYSVVAGWAMHYTYLSATNAFTGKSPEQISTIFGELYTDTKLNLFWHGMFMLVTIGVVIGGVQQGVERCSKILMPALFLMMLILFGRAMTTDGFGQAFDFIFRGHSEKLTAAGVLEALGHAFFTLSLGMGAMITYGSYLQKDDDVVSTSVTISLLDTAIALLACMVLFPITFSHGMEPAAGPGLVFKNIPVALSQMPGTTFWSTVFFALIVFAALTSAISLLEVAVSYFIDEKGWSRSKSSIVCGLAIALLGIPSAMSGGDTVFGEKFAKATEVIFGEGNGKNWFDLFDYLASNWMLPLGGLGIAMFVAWRVGPEAREHSFKAGTRFGALYWGWVALLRFLVPIGVVAVFLNAIGVMPMVFKLVGLAGE